MKMATKRKTTKRKTTKRKTTKRTLKRTLMTTKGRRTNWSSGESVIYEADVQYKSSILCVFHVSLKLNASFREKEARREEENGECDYIIFVRMRMIKVKEYY